MYAEMLASILQGREERAFLQGFLLDILGSCGVVVQISLNIPGYPKRLIGDLSAISSAEQELKRLIPPRSAGTRLFLVNAAGPALLLGYDNMNGHAVKAAAVQVESADEWARVLDVDVLTRNGTIGRSVLGLPPRTCLLCREEAKICARSGQHSLAELRTYIQKLLTDFTCSS